MVERCVKRSTTITDYVRGRHSDINRVETPGTAAGMGSSNSGSRERWFICPAVVQGERNNTNCILSLGTRAIVLRTPYRGKALQPGNDHIVIAAGAVDDEQFAIGVPAAHDAHMGIVRVEHQITRLGILPRNIGAV